MPVYVAFLRAINVGGHSVKKETLQTAVSTQGFTDVSVFKQSGNLIFQAATNDVKAVERQVHDAVVHVLGYDVAVFVRTITQLQALVKANPFRSQQPQEGTSFQVTFLPTYMSFPMQLPLRIPKSTADIICAQDREIFSVTRGHGDGGKPNPFVEKTLKTYATTRNWNIILQIVDRYT